MVIPKEHSPTLIGGAAAAGQILEVGTHTIHVAYSPDAEDESAYIGSSATVDITVTKAPLTITIANMTHIYGDPLPSIDAADATRVNVDGWIGDDGIEAFYQQMVVVNLLSQYHLKTQMMATLQVAAASLNYIWSTRFSEELRHCSQRRHHGPFLDAN